LANVSLFIPIVYELLCLASSNIIQLVAMNWENISISL
jgi:hypothetical protein